MINRDQSFENEALNLVRWESNKGFVIHPLVLLKAHQDERVKEILFNLVDMLVEEYREAEPNIIHSAELLKIIVGLKVNKYS